MLLSVLAIASANTVSLRLPLATYADLCGEMTRRTGTPYQVAREIAGRKLSIFCRDQPENDVRRAIGDALHVSWLRTPGGYQLCLSSQDAKAEVLQSERALADDRKALDAFFAGAAVVVKTPWRDQVALVARRPELKEISGFSVMARSISLLSGHTEALLRGETIVVSSESKDGVIWTGGLSTSGGLYERSERIAFRFRSSTHRLEFTLNDPHGWRGPWQSLGLQGQLGTEMPATKETEAALQQTPLMGFRAPEPAGLARCTTLGQHLQSLSDATSLPIVAQASRYAVAKEALAASPTVEGYLEELRKASDAPELASVGSWGFQNGWLVVRPKDGRRLSRREPSEAWIRPLEWAYADPKAPMIDAEAEAAHRIDPQEEAALADGSVIVADPPLRPLRESIATLRLWYALDPKSRREARGPGLPVMTSSAFQKAFEEATPVLGSGGSPPFDEASATGSWRLFVGVFSTTRYPQPYQWDLEIAGGVRTDHSNMNHVLTSYAFPNLPSIENSYMFAFNGGSHAPRSKAVQIRHREG